MRRIMVSALTVMLILPFLMATPQNVNGAAGDAMVLEKSKGNPITGVSDTGTRMYGGDPSVMVDGDTVYLYVGRDTSTTNGYSMPDWYCYSSQDMENWKCEGKVMDAGTSYIPWGVGNEAWAGQVVKHFDSAMEKDYYYFYHCGGGSQKKIGVGIADTPTGWTSVQAKAEYCSAKGITDGNPSSLLFVDLGVPLVTNSVTWPFGHNHDDIDPTAWVETDENGEERRYLAWGNTWCFIAELNDDMISLKDKDGNGLITMKTTRSLDTPDGSTRINYSTSSSTRATTQLVERPYSYPSNVNYTDLNGSHTIPAGSSYPDGDIICSKFSTPNKYNCTDNTPYTNDEKTQAAVDNDGGSLTGLLTYNEDRTMMNGIYTFSEANNPRYHFFTEAPYIYRRQDENGKYYGKYYLFFAVDWREQMAYATCDDLSEADWEFQDVIMPWTSTANTNHPAVFDFQGKTYFVYHNGSLEWGSGYRSIVCVEELNFDEDGLVAPVQETATGLSGTTSWISDTNGEYITHANFETTRVDGDYPFVGSKAKAVGMVSTEDEGDSKWEIVPGKADPTNENYVSIESWNRPGLYLAASGTNVVLSQHALANDTLPSNSPELGRSMTFKTVVGLNGQSGMVSFESVSSPGMYLTSSNMQLTMTNGTDDEACSFRVTSQAALKSISAQTRRTAYAKGAQFSASDIRVTALRQDGTEENIAVGDCSIDLSEVDMSVAGKKTATVTYKEDNFVRTSKVEIIVAEVSLDKKTLQIKENTSARLVATVNPAGATYAWSSSNSFVATVDRNGMVTGKMAGTTTIRVTAYGVTATCNVTVTKGTAPVVTPPPTPAVPKKGSKLTVKGYQYKVTKSAAKNGTVTLVKPTKKDTKKAIVPATVKLNGYTFNVTAIGAKAFRNNKKLKTVTIGKNVKSIGKQAFSGCKVLKTITIKATALNKVGVKAFKGIRSNAVIKVPKKQLATYKRLLKGKGQKKTVKIIK